MDGEVITLLFFPSLSQASPGCQWPLTACLWAACGARALLQGPETPFGNRVEIKHQLTPSPANKCRQVELCGMEAVLWGYLTAQSASSQTV